MTICQTMYAVVPTGRPPGDALALFTDEGHADTYCVALNSNSIDESEYSVVKIWLTFSTKQQ